MWTKVWWLGTVETAWVQPEEWGLWPVFSPQAGPRPSPGHVLAQLDPDGNYRWLLAA